MDIETKELIRDAVRARYRAAAVSDTPCTPTQPEIQGCCSASGSAPAQASGNCGCATEPASDPWENVLGYSAEELSHVPDGANLGLGCGNPTAIASLRIGETVVDLGSGGGMDCFLAAKQVGPDGRVIGVDMTPEMVRKARLNAEKTDTANVDFRLGEIEHLPIADGSADAVISNCVINLSVDKPQVYKEALRVLKPGGRMAVSDILATTPLSPDVRNDLSLVSACIGGAATLNETRDMLEKAGYINIEISFREESRRPINDMLPGDSEARNALVSATIAAQKPASS